MVTLRSRLVIDPLRRPPLHLRWGAGLCLVVLVAACGGGGSGGDTSAATVAGTLQVSTVGQPGETVVVESEPNDNALTANVLGPLTPGLSYRVLGAIPPEPDPDVRDLFWLVEPAAQTVTVTLTHGPDADLDIVVYDVDPRGGITPIGASRSPTSPDQVVYETPPPINGEYVTVIAVVWFSGGGAYELRIAAEAPAATTAAATGAARRLVSVAGEDRPAPAIEAVWDVSGVAAVPGQVLIRRESGALAASVAGAADDWGSLIPCGGVTGVATLLCDPEAVAASSLPADDQAAQLRRTVGRVMRLRADPRVAEAIPNYLVQPAAIPDDPQYPLQWHYPMIGLPEAWEVTTGSPGVVVAVVDTGITAHPDLAGRVVAGFDFISDPTTAGDGDGIDADPTDPGDGRGSIPNSWHGTHVAGTIGAATDNGRGVAGVDWHCKIMPLRALGRGGGTLADVLEAIRFAARLPNASGRLPAQRADVINLSLASFYPGDRASAIEQQVYDQARATGALLVAAAGNEGSRRPAFPAAAAGVVSVGAVDGARKVAVYSNSGPTIDIAAPGGDSGQDVNGDGRSDGVLSTLRDDQTGAYAYGFYEGTSMAVPHVAGVAALALAASPDLSVGQLENLLFTTATDLGTTGRDDQYGHGLVNAAEAVRQAAGAAVSPALEVAPSILNFGTSNARLEVAITNTGVGEIDVDPPTVTTNDGHPWLAAALTPGTITPVVVTVDRDGLPAGRYAGRVTLISTGGTAVVEVTLDVAFVSVLPDVGTVVVRLESATDGTVVAEVETDRDAAYAYAFADVAAGRYTIVAGTDHDGDGRLCETDDLCGAYPVLNEPAVIDVTGSSVANLNFALTASGASAVNAATP